MNAETWGSGLFCTFFPFKIKDPLRVFFSTFILLNRIINNKMFYFKMLFKRYKLVNFTQKNKWYHKKHCQDGPCWWTRHSDGKKITPLCPQKNANYLEEGVLQEYTKMNSPENTLKNTLLTCYFPLHSTADALWSSSVLYLCASSNDLPNYKKAAVATD